MDQFLEGGEFILPPNNHSDFEVRLRLTDSQDRPLYLQCSIHVYLGGGIKITVYAPFWIVNQTGLPLVFRQEGSNPSSGGPSNLSSNIAAGQDVEHEIARMAAPLLFSFNDDGNPSLTMRIGTGLHSQGKVQWCRHFYVQQQGVRVRRLRVSHNPVEWVYIIGIDVRPGKGRYNQTNIITLTPRFQLQNESHYRIQFAQRCFTTTFHDPEAEATYLNAFPNSNLSFHWPRLDRDQLLCIKLLDVADCLWSGGFRIEQVDSFQITVRDSKGRGIPIRIQVGIVGATFSIILSDAENFPPPFRIDNFSQVSISCHQSGVSELERRNVIKPHQSIPYALDEPTLNPHLICEAPGGSSATYNLNILGEGSQLTYENFIYIALTMSFDGNGEELVLDVEGTRVYLSRKQTGKRSQLWRMTSIGLLQHEGSSPPQDPRSAQVLDNVLVLDIAGPAVQPDTFVPLMLRKPDETKNLNSKMEFYQRWKAHVST